MHIKRHETKLFNIFLSPPSLIFQKKWEKKHFPRLFASQSTDIENRIDGENRWKRQNMHERCCQEFLNEKRERKFCKQRKKIPIDTEKALITNRKQKLMELFIFVTKKMPIEPHKVEKHSTWKLMIDLVANCTIWEIKKKVLQEIMFVCKRKKKKKEKSTFSRVPLKAEKGKQSLGFPRRLFGVECKLRHACLRLHKRT